MEVVRPGRPRHARAREAGGHHTVPGARHGTRVPRLRAIIGPCRPSGGLCPARARQAGRSGGSAIIVLRWASLPYLPPPSRCSPSRFPCGRPHREVVTASQAGATGVVSALHHVPIGDVWPVEEIRARINQAWGRTRSWGVYVHGYTYQAGVGRRSTCGWGMHLHMCGWEVG